MADWLVIAGVLGVGSLFMVVEAVFFPYKAMGESEDFDSCDI